MKGENTEGNRKVKSLINYDRYEASKLSYTFKLLQEKCNIIQGQKHTSLCMILTWVSGTKL